ncbi:unnamed protein product [Caenorhabditis bovis]|uniref:EGF-like domain-containing protein n=1 Tax=Caenorhabditis bovis TaxID=2654633 RepID=A0A8S1EDJ1_9PELO|nr:unnamed protein product [Caenorhabditis bovis]
MMTPCETGVHRILNDGEFDQTYECACDYFHTGQHCEIEVPLPWAFMLTSTILTLVLILSVAYSAARFSNKKIYLFRERERFVDLLEDVRLSACDSLEAAMRSNESTSPIATTTQSASENRTKTDEASVQTKESKTSNR